MLFLFRNKKVSRVFASTLSLVVFTQVFAPAAAWALTAGPTAPEFSSFEPVDTTDMVNLQTGDFTYNIPLLEVPGPEGGYPLALSYHSGISPDEEASWAGLGWTLNPGSINRMVNVYPDDFKGSAEAIHDRWNGGEENTVSVGAGWGPYYMGLTFANDTYKGSGVGFDASIGVPLTGKTTTVGGSTHDKGKGKQGSLQLNLAFGVGPYGKSYLGLGLAATSGSPGDATGGSASIGVMYKIDGDGDGQVSVNGGVRYKQDNINQSIMGYSLSSANSNGGESTRALGLSAESFNNNANNITHEYSGFDINVAYQGFSASYGMTKYRYYMDQWDKTIMYGSLYPSAGTIGDIKNSFDSFVIKENSTTSFIGQNPDKTLGGSLPAFDNYAVLGQGVGGSIQPYMCEYAPLYRKNYDVSNASSVTGKDFIKFTQQAYPQSDGKIAFRFSNDFSNRYVYNADSPNTVSDCSPDGLVEAGSAGHRRDNTTAKEGFDRSTGYLAGSKSVQWFTNSQMSDGSNIKLMKNDFYWGNNVKLDGYGVNLPDQIAGFSVTTEAGLTYHYALPVYNLNKVSCMNSTDYNKTTSDYHPYAYAWLLTGVTGPDFVDRGLVGVIDDQDWGYWVKMDYGLWTDQYQWRNPSEGTHRDVASNSSFYSYGKKQMYYLNAVHTRTHTALFVKDIRNDAKGISSNALGGFGIIKNPSTGAVTGLPAASLRLDRILLFENSSLNKTISSSTTNTNSYEALAGLSSVLSTDVTNIPDNLKRYDEFNNQISLDFKTGYDALNFHKGYNVLDLYDLNVLNKYNSGTLLNDLRKIAVREIEFDNNHYDLCKQTPNSFDYAYNQLQPKGNNDSGKLTLKGLKFYSKNQHTTIPPTSFTYSQFNPGYNKDKKDMWDSYCSDCMDASTASGQVPATNEKYYERYTSSESAKQAEAWSLTRISTPMGADIAIEYESDQYHSALSNEMNVLIKGVKLLSATKEIEITLYSDSDLKTLVYDDNMRQKILNARFVSKGNFYRDESAIELHKKHDNSLDVNTQITGVNGDKIIVKSDILYDKLNVGLYQVGAFQQHPDSYLESANLLLQRPSTEQFYGGGLRTKSIQLISDGKTNKTQYTYENGVTSYDPFDMLSFSNLIIVKADGLDNTFKHDNILPQDYQDIVAANYKSALAYANFLPAPGVSYGKVTVSESVYDQNTKKTYNQGTKNEYEFTTFDPVTMNPAGPTRYFDENHRKVTYRNLSNQIGLLQSIKTYNSSGNIIDEVSYDYLHHGKTVADYNTKLKSAHSGQGRFDQLFHEQKTVNGVSKEIITELENYPVIRTKVASRNNLTGIEQETVSLTYDFFTGLPTKTLIADTYGNYYVNETLLAYQQYPTSNMGVWMPTSSMAGNKNMLSQDAAAYTYKVKLLPTTSDPYDYNTVSLLSASAQIWSNKVPVDGAPNSIQNDIWRKQSSYSWVGTDAGLRTDGLHTFAEADKFDFSADATNPKWQQGGEFTRFDIFTRPLESKDINGIYSSVLTSPQNTYFSGLTSTGREEVIAAAANTSISELIASGAEYQRNDNDLIAKAVNSVRVNAFAHTGSWSMMTPAGTTTFNSTFTPVPNKLYKASVWVYLSNSDDDNTKLDNVKLVCKQGSTTLKEAGRVIGHRAGSWQRIDLLFKPATNTPVQVYAANNAASFPVYFDDFRVSSATGGIITYVYNPDTKQLTYILDSENLATKYVYNEQGKLAQIYKEVFDPAAGFKLVSQTKLNYSKK